MMKVYHSAFEMNEDYASLLMGRKVRILQSFAVRVWDEIPSYCSGMFLDSGAFSAYNSGNEIKLDDYVSFLHKRGDEFEAYANLDVIGNAPASWKNQLRMVKRGLMPIPCFHYGEPIEYWYRYLDRFEYIALGGRTVARTRENLRRWYDRCWKILSDTNPKVKVHGFGMTDMLVTKMYPWYSVDSTTAARAGRVGVLVLPPWGQLRVSTGIKSYSKGSSVVSPSQIKAVERRLKELFPDRSIKWKDISEPTKDASYLRTVINAFVIERELEEHTPSKGRTGFAL